MRRIQRWRAVRPVFDRPGGTSCFCVWGGMWGAKKRVGPRGVFSPCRPQRYEVYLRFSPRRSSKRASPLCRAAASIRSSRRGHPAAARAVHACLAEPGGGGIVFRVSRTAVVVEASSSFRVPSGTGASRWGAAGPRDLRSQFVATQRFFDRCQRSFAEKSPVFACRAVFRAGRPGGGVWGRGGQQKTLCVSPEGEATGRSSLRDGCTEKGVRTMAVGQSSFLVAPVEQLRPYGSREPPPPRAGLGAARHSKAGFFSENFSSGRPIRRPLGSPLRRMRSRHDASLC